MAHFTICSKHTKCEGTANYNMLLKLHIVSTFEPSRSIKLKTNHKPTNPVGPFYYNTYKMSAYTCKTNSELNP